MRPHVTRVRQLQAIATCLFTHASASAAWHTTASHRLFYLVVARIATYCSLQLQLDKLLGKLTALTTSEKFYERLGGIIKCVPTHTEFHTIV